MSKRFSDYIKFNENNITYIPAIIFSLIKYDIINHKKIFKFKAYNSFSGGVISILSPLQVPQANKSE